MDLLTTLIAAQYSSHDGGVPKCVEIMSVCDRNLKLKNEKKVDTTCRANWKEVCGFDKLQKFCKVKKKENCYFALQGKIIDDLF